MPRAASLTATRLLVTLACLLAATAVCVAVCASIGSSGYSTLDAIRGGRDSLAADLILRLRLPRLAVAALAGAALGAAGAVFQAILRNPLADPYILGVSGGAALGAFLATVVGLPAFIPYLPLRAVAAFAGAVATIGFIFVLSNVHGRIASYPMLLIGVITNTIYLALILFIQTFVETGRLHGVQLWLVGTIPVESWSIVLPLGACLVAGITVLGAAGRELNLLSAGEDAARSLGVAVERSRIAWIGLSSLLTAAVVAVTGPIGFVGLIVPHAARLLFGPDHRLMVPSAAFCGAIFLMTADTVARTILAPTELPVGVVTALCGGPFFLWLYRARRGGSYFE